MNWSDFQTVSVESGEKLKRCHTRVPKSLDVIDLVWTAVLFCLGRDCLAKKDGELKGIVPLIDQIFSTATLSDILRVRAQSL